MKVVFAPRGILQITDARIIFRNFKGEGSKFNREGDRNFALIIPDEEIAEALKNAGWNVKIKAPRDPDDTPFMYLGVKVKFNDRGPDVYLESGKKVNMLSEEDVDVLDDIDILSVDMHIRPYDYEVNGSTGRAAYLQKIWVTQQIDSFAQRYADYAPDDEVQY